MRPSAIFQPMATIALMFPSVALASRVLFTRSLDPCPGSSNTGFTPTLFQAALDADAGTASYNFTAVVSINGNVNATIDVSAYGYPIKTINLDPCTDAALSQLCPLTAHTYDLPPANLNIDKKTLDAIPSVAYGVPDVDALIRATIFNATSGQAIACVQAALSNGQTVDQTAVKWVTAIITGIALATSAIMNGLGHSNAAAHIAANALSLFGYFQGQAIIGMTGVRFPPIAQSWVQNFAWTMGIVRIGFMQTVLTWYQRATAGTPTSLLTNLDTYSVAVEKRDVSTGFIKRDASSTGTLGQSEVYGIERMGFREGIEPTNVFLTGLGIFVAFVVAAAVCVGLFKVFCEFAAKRGWIKGDQFLGFRNGWKVFLKGILFRIILLGYPQMSILCLWELTVRNSIAEVVTAILYFVFMTLILAGAAYKVWSLAKRSMSMHKNAAYVLYSDPATLNKWGFLYVQYRATAYYWIFPQLAYIILKAMFIAFAQANGPAQAIGLLIIELAWLVAVSCVRPWMDKKTNGFNIAIAAFNFFGAIMLLIFSNIFNQPALATGIAGVLFAFANIVFATVLLILVLLASGYAVFSKNPETRYQALGDKRDSFIRSHTNLTANTELDALGQTARGTNKHLSREFDDDVTSYQSPSKESYGGGSAPVYHDRQQAYQNPYSQGHGYSDHGAGHGQGQGIFAPDYGHGR